MFIAVYPVAFVLDENAAQKDRLRLEEFSNDRNVSFKGGKWTRMFERPWKKILKLKKTKKERKRTKCSRTCSRKWWKQRYTRQSLLNYTCYKRVPLRTNKLRERRILAEPCSSLPSECLSRCQGSRKTRGNDFRSRQELIIPSSKTPRIFAFFLVITSCFLSLCLCFFGGKGSS